MDASSQQTLAALHHFAHTGEWGDFPAERVELSQFRRPKQRKDVLFVTRDPKWDATIPQYIGREKMGVIRVSAVPPRSEFTPGVEVWFGDGGHSLFPRFLYPQYGVYEVSAQSLPWLVQSLEVATLEVGPLAELLNAIGQPIVDPARPLPPRKEFDPFLDGTKKRIAATVEDLWNQEPRNRFCKLDHAWIWFEGIQHLQGSESESLSEEALRAGLEKQIGVSVPPRRNSATIQLSEPFNRTPLGRKNVFEWKDEELEAWLADSRPAGARVGGPVELAFTSRLVPRISPSTRFDSEAELRESGLWWWEEKDSWPELVKGWFADNWERSAFYYEFRARRSMRKFGFWPFQVPWAWLGQRDRAALYYLWPVLGKRHSFCDEASFVTSPLRNSGDSSLIVDVFHPWVEIEKHVRERKLELVAKALPNDQLHWDLLKELDLYWFVAGGGKSLVSNHKKPIKEQYERVCKRLKLKP